MHRALGAAIALGVVLAASTFDGFSGQRSEDLILVSHRGQSQQDLRFIIEGSSVGGLYPGKTKEIQLYVANRHGFAFRLESLDAKVISTSRRQCVPTGTNIVVKRYAGKLPLTMRANERTKIGKLPVMMPKDASPKCSDTKFVISLSGTGSKAGR